MKINSKITVQSKYNPETDVNETKVDLDKELTISELLTLLELGKNTIMGIIEQYIKNNRGGSVTEGEYYEIMKQPLKNIL